jgi:hypothetical protein
MTMRGWVFAPYNLLTDPYPFIPNRFAIDYRGMPFAAALID